MTTTTVALSTSLRGKTTTAAPVTGTTSHGHFYAVLLDSFYSRTRDFDRTTRANDGYGHGHQDFLLGLE